MPSALPLNVSASAAFSLAALAAAADVLPVSDAPAFSAALPTVASTSAEAAFAAAVSVPVAQPSCSASDEGRRLSLFSVIICTVPFARGQVYSEFLP